MDYVYWENSAGEKPVQEFLMSSLSQKERDKVSRQIYILHELGYYQLAKQGDFEKIDKMGVWEFKINFGKSHFRIFCGIELNKYIFLHMIRKKYKKLHMKDIRLSKERLKIYRQSL